jgi:hypothetical protein
VLGSDVAKRVSQLQRAADLCQAVAFQRRLGPSLRHFDGALHRLAEGPWR